jgi:hypothetical protein
MQTTDPYEWGKEDVYFHGTMDGAATVMQWIPGTVARDVS